MKFKHYFRYTIAVITMSYQSATVYRTHFILRLVRALIEIYITLVVLSAVFQATPLLGSYNQNDTVLIATIALITVSLVYFLFGQGVEGLHRQIVTGRLDRMLLQPLDAQWLVSTNIIYITNIFRLLFSLVLFFSTLSNLQLTFSFTRSLLFLVTLVSGAVVYFSIIFSASIISFWALSGELFYLINSLSTLAKYPIDIFNYIVRTVLTLIPIIFIATVPAKALLGQTSFLIYSAPMIAAISLFLTRRLWYKGLHSYESASS